MNAKLSFLTIKTSFGNLFTMRVQGGSAKLTGLEGPVDYNLTAVKPEGVAWVGPALLAENGQAFRIGRQFSKALVAWKSIKISKRFGREGYRMRSVHGGYKGDYVTSWSRAFNGRTYSFSRIFWNAGQDGATLRVYEGQSTKVVHEWHVKGPVTMKGKKQA
ncbi:hypothetical protein SEA_BOGOTA_13 [Streptomyces phage Bogota]|nr:hypothetical protein SEA_BOGOTA_13 [Streptomyces phage Bogota]